LAQISVLKAFRSWQVLGKFCSNDLCTASDNGFNDQLYNLYYFFISFFDLADNLSSSNDIGSPHCKLSQLSGNHISFRFAQRSSPWPLVSRDVGIRLHQTFCEDCIYIYVEFRVNFQNKNQEWHSSVKNPQNPPLHLMWKIQCLLSPEGPKSNTQVPTTINISTHYFLSSMGHSVVVTLGVWVAMIYLFGGNRLKYSKNAFKLGILTLSIHQFCWEHYFPRHFMSYLISL
jgi:hypothetical protein